MKNVRELQKLAPVEVKVSMPVQDQTYSNELTGIAKFVNHLEKTFSTEMDEKKKLLVGNELDKIQTVDIYQPIGRNPIADIDMSTLNEDQRAAVQLSREAPAGFVNIHGPPGTGKTHVMGEMCRPFVIANKPDYHVLAVSASNHSTDALACRFNRIVRESGHEGQYVVRVHALGTETDLAMRLANRTRKIPDGAKPRVVDLNLGEGEQQLFNAVEFASRLHAIYARKHSHFLETISDDRVTEESYRMALGTRILQIMGEIEPGKHDPKSQDKFIPLRTLYRQWTSGEEFDQERMGLFRRYMDEAREDVLTGAIAVVGTPAGVLFPRVYTPIEDSIHITMVDEAARLTEAASIAMIGTFPRSHFIVAGDLLQLPPPVMNPKATFAKQLGMSLQTRMMGNGTPSVMLRTQYRMSPKISKPLNEYAYLNRLEDHVQTTKKERPILHDIMDFNSKLLGKRSYATILDIRGTKTEQTPQTLSRYNVIMAQCGLNLGVELCNKFTKMSGTIICFYNAQYLLYLAMIDKIKIKAWREDPPNHAYDGLQVYKADTVQGLEFGWVITDYTVGDRVGFLNVLQRHVTANSRAMFIQYVLMDKEHIIRLRGDNELKRWINSFLKLGTLVKTEEPHALRRSEFYTPDLTDFSTVALGPVVTDTERGVTAEATAKADAARMERRRR